MLRVTSSGNWKKTKDSLNKLVRNEYLSELRRYGEMGVAALAKATPVDSGLTAQSWEYRIVRSRNGPTIEWYNTNVVDGTSVAILIQYGHGLRSGGYIQGRDYINPATRPIFDKIADEVWKKVKS